jgi:GntR family transcriptional regulator/MocR family aminotransferase
VPKRSASPYSLLLKHSHASSLPRQIAQLLRSRIETGELCPGDYLPSSRELAQVMQVSRGTVVSAYEQLVAEGYLLTGHRTMVHPELLSFNVRKSIQPRIQKLPTRNQRPLPLTPGYGVSELSHRPAWRRAFQHAREVPHIHTPAAGLATLRNALSDYLRVTRGHTQDPANILVTAGAREGLTFLINALLLSSDRTAIIGVEDPGYPPLRRVAARLGVRLVGIPVDEQGIVVEAIPEGLLDAILVTPSQQFPVGGTLPLARRMQLVNWAHKRGVLLIEDDFDAVLRHRGDPLPLLSSLDDPRSGVVITLASFSPVLPVTGTIGFLTASANLSRVLLRARHDLGCPAAVTAQTVLHDLIQNDELFLSLTRQRQELDRRFQTLGSVLGQTEQLRLLSQPGGINAVIGASESNEETVQHLRTALVGPVAESAYWSVNQPHAQPRFVVGLGGCETDEFEQALTRLVNVFEQ